MKRLINIMLFTMMICLPLSTMSAVDTSPYFKPDDVFMYPMISIRHNGAEADLFIIQQRGGLSIYMSNLGRIKYIRGFRFTDTLHTAFFLDNDLYLLTSVTTDDPTDTPPKMTGIQYSIFPIDTVFDRETGEVFLFTEGPRFMAFNNCFEGTYPSGRESTCDLKDEQSIRAFIKKVSQASPMDKKDIPEIIK